MVKVQLPHHDDTVLMVVTLLAPVALGLLVALLFGHSIDIAPY
jgi:hypothetical protein